MLCAKGHKIQLLPNNHQRSIFQQWAGAHRWAYNWGLDRWKETYESIKKSPSTYGLMKEIVQLKKTEGYVWLGGVAKSVPRIALMHLENAFKRFFQRCKIGTVVKGYPNYKSRHRCKMVFHLEVETVKIEGKRIRISKLGWIRMTKPLRFQGKLVGTVAISERAGKWFASLNVETEYIPVESQDRAVGIDLGVKTLAVLSDGTTFVNPRITRRYEQLLARAQRQLARKKKGSARRYKAKLRVTRIQKRIADCRADAIHKATRAIADQYAFVGMEDLNAIGMVKNHKLAKAVSDASFGEFRRQVEYKLGWEQGEVVFVDRFFPSSRLCLECGCINSALTLSDRVWTCDCGAVHERDLNAARNILAEALRIADG